MSFEPSLWDDSDPFYAPLLQWTKGKYPAWRPSKRYIKAGYSIKRIKLPGVRGDGRDLERAALCREYTRDLVGWWKRNGELAVEAGTLEWLVHKYSTDQFSPIHNVKPNTRMEYRRWVGVWGSISGTVPLSAIDYERLSLWLQEMRDNGRSADRIKRMFTMLRILMNYGVMLGNRDCERVSMILSKMRIPSPPQRSVQATREHVEAIVAAADRSGAHNFATGVLLQFELALRAVDVRGQWLPLASGEIASGIVRGGKRWADGITADMFDGDLATLTKVISKTVKSLPDPITFDLTPLPHLRERIRLLLDDHPMGPLIVSERHRLPYTRHAWAAAWRNFREQAGVPAEVKSMDARSGGISEAQVLGADAATLRDAAQHRNLSTTDRYMRSRSENVNRVIQMRHAKTQLSA